jgi:pimeloyl-ACP methyl ester carboxylesterase
MADDQYWFALFRLGIWPDFFPGVQFPRDSESLNQFFRQMTPDTGPFNAGVIADTVVALFDRIGPGVLVTHSRGGGLGWITAIRSRNVRAVVSYEPGSGFTFPEGELPPPMPSSAGTLEAVDVPMKDFLQLTKIPIVIYYGDNIPVQVSGNPGQDAWRVRLAMARLWVKAVNGKGGHARLVHLPDISIRGNTHFPFSDLNNTRIADLLSLFLTESGLDDD